MPAHAIGFRLNPSPSDFAATKKCCVCVLNSQNTRNFGCCKGAGGEEGREFPDPNWHDSGVGDRRTIHMPAGFACVAKKHFMFVVQAWAYFLLWKSFDDDIFSDISF